MCWRVPLLATVSLRPCCNWCKRRNRCSTGPPFAADDGRFGAAAVFHDIEQREDGSNWEVEVRDASACVKEHLASAELDGFQMLAPAGHIGRRNSSEQGVHVVIATPLVLFCTSFFLVFHSRLVKPAKMIKTNTVIT